MHWSLGDALQARCYPWKELGRDVTVGSRGKQTLKWTVFFLIGEAGHIRERVHGNGIICRQHASFRLSIIPHSPEPTGTVTHMSLVDVFRLTLNTLDREEALQGKEARHFWNPIISNGSEVEDQRLNQSGFAGSSSSNIQLIYHPVNDSRPLIYGFRRAELDVWIGWLLDLCDLTDCDSHSFWLPATGGRFHLTGIHVKGQAGHKNFDHDEDRSPGFFVIVTWLMGAILYACLGSQHFLFYPDNERERLAKTLRTKGGTIPPRSVFIGYGS